MASPRVSARAAGSKEVTPMATAAPSRRVRVMSCPPAPIAPLLEYEPPLGLEAGHDRRRAVEQRPRSHARLGAQADQRLAGGARTPHDAQPPPRRDGGEPTLGNLADRALADDQ